MDNIREQIYLAALLHDIGKFYQRADTGSVKSSKYLKEYSKVESAFCPLRKDGTYTHKHVLWTAQFIEDYQAVFNRLLNNNSNNCKSLIELAACHHLKSEQLTEYANLIKEADSLSSGMDRDSELAYKDEQDELKNWDSFKSKAMTSILETIQLSLKDIELKQQWHHIPLNPLSLDKSTFPTKEKINPDYEQLWSQFITDFKFIQADTYHAFSETFLNLLSKYTSSIPSSTINFPDVSLYDHLKTTAAISVCLFDVRASEENPDKPFLLIGADLSGIQSYIYEIVSKYAAKNLKGRSFYLRILSDSVVRFLLKSLNLFHANIIYNSAGSFYLLAPNTSLIRNALQEATLHIETHLFNTHRTSLFVAIDSIEVSRDALLHKNGASIGELWGKLFVMRDAKKSRKFSSLIKNNYSSFFDPILNGADTERDIITGEEFLAEEPRCSEKELSPLKKITQEQIELGKALRESEVMVVSEEEIPYWKDRTHISPAHLGSTYYFIKWDDLSQMKKELRASADKVTVITLNGRNGDCNFMRHCTIDGVNNIYALEFYGGNENDRNNLPTFEEMCEKDSENTFKRLGVLRMDVDNLGSIFQKGILPERASLSRFAALSRSLDYFFSGYLNTIWKEVAPEQSFIIYSGGDDLFIVGSWEKTIEIAERIREDFKGYSCNNPAFTISGGIAIVPAKFPIMKGADESGLEEANAKKHKAGNQTKNSISIMDTPLNWDMEYFQVKSLKDNILSALKTEKLPKSFTSKILAHTANAYIHDHKFTRKGIKTYWMLTYELSRMNDRYKNSIIEHCITEVCANKNELNGSTIETRYHKLELWAFACRWAELELRTN